MKPARLDEASPAGCFRGGIDHETHDCASRSCLAVGSHFAGRHMEGPSGFDAPRNNNRKCRSLKQAPRYALCRCERSTPGGFYLDNALQCNFPEVISALMAAGVRSVTYPNGRTSLFTPVETGHPANLEVFADILRKQMSLVDLHEYVNTQRYQWWHSPHESRWRRIRFFKLYGRTHAIETCDVFSFFGS